MAESVVVEFIGGPLDREVRAVEETPDVFTVPILRCDGLLADPNSTFVIRTLAYRRRERVIVEYVYAGDYVG